METVHVAIVRQVKPGCEREFELVLREFARESLREPGTTGVQLIAPVPGTAGCEYGVLRSFESEAASSRFYESEIYHQWRQRVSPLVVGDAAMWRLHGLEAFFHNSNDAPPRWKMAVVTWLGVFPSVLLWSSTLTKRLTGLPELLVIAIVNILVVATLTWVVMPLLTRLFGAWLHASNKS